MEDLGRDERDHRGEAGANPAGEVGSRRLEPNRALDIPVVHEADDFLVLDKPAGVPVHPNDFDDTGTVVNFLLARYPEVEGVGEGCLRPGIVHRLDTGTTGLLLVARTAAAQGNPKFEYGKAEEVKAVEWKAQAKGGSLLTRGNSETINCNLGLSVSRKEGFNKVAFDAGVAYGRSRVITATADPVTLSAKPEPVTFSVSDSQSMPAPPVAVAA